MAGLLRNVSLCNILDIFVKDERHDNDTALRLLLEFVNEEDRFLFYLDKLIRPKVIKGTPFFMNTIEGLYTPEKVQMLE